MRGSAYAGLLVCVIASVRGEVCVCVCVCVCVVLFRVGRALV